MTIATPHTPPFPLALQRYKKSLTRPNIQQKKFGHIRKKCYLCKPKYNTMLFREIIIGPIHSRRLGTSLGINLLRPQAKMCTFNCIYCECGLNFMADSKLPTADEVRSALKAKLQELKADSQHIDVITFAGNGEPTTHPEFARIVDDVITLRDTYFPTAKLSLLSNATMLHKPEIVETLHKIDNNILKIDSAIEATAKAMNQPQQPGYSIAKVIAQMKAFRGECIIQTMFLRGNGIDNTTEREVSAWVEAIKAIMPREVQLYSLDRKPPMEGLHKVSGKELETIAAKVNKLGIKTLVTY